MTTIRVDPGVPEGRLTAPSSKSYTHRALVVGSLAGHRFDIVRPLVAADTLRTLAGLRRLGIPIATSPDRWTVAPSRSARRTRPVGIDCGQSGTTLRLLCARAALEPRSVRFIGSGALPRRPIRPLVSALRQLGARARLPRGTRSLPLELRGPISSGTATVDAAESSQFASALALVLPGVPGDSSLRLRGELVSMPYLDATFRALHDAGIEVDRSGRRVTIPGGQTVHARSMAIPGDASAAAYGWAAAALTGGDVEIRGVPIDRPQADLHLLDLLARSGVQVDVVRDRIRVRGRLSTPIWADLRDTPDLLPLVGVLAAGIPATSELRGVRRLARKESDRLVGTAALVRSLGAKVRVSPDALQIEGTARFRPIRSLRLADHRMVMSAAVAALRGSGPSYLGDGDAVAKSYPGFWRDLASLGLTTNVERGRRPSRVGRHRGSLHR
jgi:3-phosphoshikimate 1-carboxyvinyltransferase